MRLLICAGGTGGGVYPALSVLKQLMNQKPESTSGSPTPDGSSSPDELQVLWVGGRGGMEADLVKREGLRFEAIPAAGVHGVGARALPGNLWQLGGGFFSSRRILRKFRPDVLFFTGGSWQPVLRRAVKVGPVIEKEQGPVALLAELRQPTERPSEVDPASLAEAINRASERVRAAAPQRPAKHRRSSC